MDCFDKIYYKIEELLDNKSIKILFEKECIKNINNKLGTHADALVRSLRSKKPYYLHKRANRKFIITKIEDERIKKT